MTGGSLDVLGISATASDMDGDSEFEYLWTSCLEDLEILNSDTSSPSLESLVEGSYCLNLSVTDAYGASGEASVEFTVTAESNEAPQANAGSNQTIEIVHNDIATEGDAEVVLSCSGEDLEGCELSYEWLDVDGVSISNSNTVSLLLEEGEYSYTCIVTDSYGLTSSDDVSVSVYEPNQVVSDDSITFEITGSTLLDHYTGETTVNLNGCATTDPDGDDLTYSWVKVIEDGEMPLITGLELCQHDVVINEAGTHTFGLRVSDTYMDSNEMTSGMHTVSVDITFENQNPQIVSMVVPGVN